MFEDREDAGLARRQLQFLHEIEKSIRAANLEILHAQIPELNRESIVKFAVVVAKLRATYLQSALALAGTEASPALVATLRQQREAYEEACAAFEALQRAIERGYVDVGAPAAA